ncbi:MAG: DUF2950 domain-containing protein [Pseudolabrys sp.]
MTLIRAFGKLALATAIGAFALVSVAAAQEHFKSPGEAADALATAARAGDRKAIEAILGPGANEIVSSGDAVQDENARKVFVAAFDINHRIEGNNPATLVIGQGDFPFAIPIVQSGDTWMFDALAGREEVFARRIGRNELAAIQVCLAYFDAQNDYADVTPKVNGMAVYAQRIVSSPGKKDGLYWPAAQGEPQSPIGEAVAFASARGYRVGSHEPYHGYYYKILKRQGPAAPGGEIDYVVDGNMVGGFALIAWPAQYGNSGVATFIVNSNGDVFEKDLGADTQKVAAHLTWFNPDKTWKTVGETEMK